jgi:transposase
VVAQLMVIGNGKLYRWYKDHLSGFKEDATQKKLHQHDIISEQIDRQTGLPEIARVPILKPENMGTDMCIDEKYIGGEFYTLLANRETGKIAMMAGTQNTAELCKLLQKIDLDKRFGVRHLTRDLLNAYDWTGRQMFPNAEHIADKFHILQHLFDALQSIRIYHRNVYLTARRQAYENFKTKESERKKICLSQNETFTPSVFQHREERLENGETNRELLARSLHLLFKFSGQWNSSQSKRAEILFKHYPDIHTAYKLCCSFREWYSKEYIGQPIDKIKKRLKAWFDKVKASGMEEMLNFKSLVERHLGVILSYFKEGKTNANAESLNAKIQRFLQANNGSRDLDFTFFRLANFFS